MSMLSGTWNFEAIGNEAGWKQRITLTGTSAHDGPHELVLGSKLFNVAGERFEVVAQALDPAINQWVNSLMDEKARWENDTGLVITLRCDDNPAAADGDFNDLIVQCTAQDKVLTSPFSGVTRPDLSIPREFIKQPKDGRLSKRRIGRKKIR